MQYLLDFHFDWSAKTFNRLKEDKIILIVLRRIIRFPALAKKRIIRHINYEPTLSGLSKSSHRISL